MSLFCLVHKVSWEPEGCPKCIGEFKALEVERDALKEELKEAKKAGFIHGAIDVGLRVRDAMSADRDAWKKQSEELYLSMDTWRSLAEGLAGALKKIIKGRECLDSECDPTEIAKKALVSYDDARQNPKDNSAKRGTK